MIKWIRSECIDDEGNNMFFSLHHEITYDWRDFRISWTTVILWTGGALVGWLIGNLI